MLTPFSIVENGLFGFNNHSTVALEFSSTTREYKSSRYFALVSKSGKGTQKKRIPNIGAKGIEQGKIEADDDEVDTTMVSPFR